MQIESKDKLVAVKAYARGNALPLDASSIFDSYEEAETYATSDPTAYDLQLVTVNNNGTPELYVVQNKKLVPAQPKVDTGIPWQPL